MKLKPDKIPAILPPEWVEIIVDPREQTPWDCAPMKAISCTLTTGDYSVQNLTHLVALERKSLPDFIGVCGKGRDRFEREISRLLAYPTRGIICEFSYADLLKGEWLGQITATQAAGSAAGWIATGVPIIFAGNRENAQTLAMRILYTVARRNWSSSRPMLKRVCELAAAAEQEQEAAAAAESPPDYSLGTEGTDGK